MRNIAFQRHDDWHNVETDHRRKIRNLLRMVLRKFLKSLKPNGDITMATTFLERTQLRNKYRGTAYSDQPVIDNAPGLDDVEKVPAPVTKTGKVNIGTLPDSVHRNDTVLPPPEGKVIKADAKHKTLVGSAGNDIFEGTLADFKGATLKNFNVGDAIHFTDAIQGNFHFKDKGNSLEFSNFDYRHFAYDAFDAVSGAMTGGMTLKFSNDPLGHFTWDKDTLTLTLAPSTPTLG
jgi:hypothetical protein